MSCPSSGTGKHCSCIASEISGICCYCDEQIIPEPPDAAYDDDGSEENTDA